MYELELKYRIEDVSQVLAKLDDIGAIESVTESHEDTYYRHPCRDFTSTGEALRLRRIDGRPYVTYKGGKQLVGHGDVSGIKLRRELEWDLAPGDQEGSKMAEMLESLGFSVVARVVKQRRPFDVEFGGTKAVVTIDAVDGIGMFAEIEVLCEGQAEQQRATEAISGLARQLGVVSAESRSYLRMVLEVTGDS